MAAAAVLRACPECDSTLSPNSQFCSACGFGVVGQVSGPATPGTTNVYTTVNMTQAAPTVTVINAGRNGPNFLVRLLWFVCIGIWVGSVATAVGYVLCLSVLGLPIGLVLLNRLPQIMTLRPYSNTTSVVVSGNATVVTLGVGVPQVSFLVRALYFLVVGWWLAGLWLTIAWALTIIWPLTLGLSLAPAFLMFDRLPAVLTLRRN